MWRERLDMRLDLDVGAEFVADRRLEFRGDGVSAADRHGSVELDVDADGEALADLLGDDVMRQIGRAHV